VTEERKLVLTPATAFLPEMPSEDRTGLEDREGANSACGPPPTGVGLQPLCGWPVTRCAACQKSIAPSRIRRNLGCPKHPDADREPDSCANPVKAAGMRCRLHLGTPPPAVKAAAVRREVAAEATSMLAELEGAPPIGDPILALSEQAGLLVSWQTILMRKLDEIGDLATTDSVGVQRVAAVAELFTKSLDQVARILGSLSKLGLQQRRVEIEERQAEALIGLVLAALAQAEIAEPGRQRFVEALSRELRSVAPGTPLRPVA